jgi:hypothetical protein
MNDVFVLTETGVTALSINAVLWLIERATLEFPDGTLDRLDQGLAEGVVALNASDLDAIARFFDERIEAVGTVAPPKSPELTELAEALKAWARSDSR